MRTSYKVRAYPTPEQAAVLNRTFGCVRLVWNKVLTWRRDRYHTQRITTSYAETDRYLTELKRDPDLEFLSKVSSVPLQQTLRHQHTAFVNFFAGRARYPRYKSRQRKQSATYTQSAFRWREGRLYLARMMGVQLEVVWSWPEIDPASLEPTSVTVSREPCGRWYVSLAVEIPDPQQAPPTGAVVGVDLGVKDFAVTSDGEKIANARRLAMRERNLARYQRRMARKQSGSSNRAKAKVKVARAHRKVAASRADFLHKTSARLVRDHDVIVIEDLAVQNMVRNRRLAKAISDCGWGEFRRQLEYKAAKYGRRLIVIDRWYPSSKTCSVCGHLLTELSLSTRAWCCPSCRTLHDRDVNAAKNILAAGLAVSACGGDVRHPGSPRAQSPQKQEPQPARAGIPALQSEE
ncbi:RNA-guided endonuclease InsQ/TnpB family protein [Actinoallomurus iriomotensis]|uniref:Transposase n=1 Tax=Actinoallomurus iriomotensis TaxID=478107 RepID=A0A9W6S8T9_9ACTN|nr:RNA-guided endonuclease TnpB family protein [Actinoallomurus iriomotensis]GLY89178.1 transposase [Actinoallomurus iriomotensis]